MSEANVLHHIYEDIGRISANQSAAQWALEQHLKDEEKRFKFIHFWMALLTVINTLVLLGVSVTDAVKAVL